MPNEEIKDKIGRDEENAYLMALEPYREKIKIDASKRNLLRIKTLLRNNHPGLLQTIEGAKSEILQRDRKFGSYRILLKTIPEISSESKIHEPNHKKSISQRKCNKKIDNDFDIDR
jgi:hypothetical protein